MRLTRALGPTILLLTAVQIAAADANRLTWLDGSDPYYVSRDFPRLVTPQWVGEEGVEAVVILSIDDMNQPEKYETYLRPILDRLKKIDGRAPVSIMTTHVDPLHLQVRGWLKEGLSLEAHTFVHPCPILAGGNFDKAKATYDRCVDLLFLMPGTRPVAFRTPCCDSMNTNSPRLYAEIFNRTTAGGRFLTIDSSVFNILTANDPALPRELVIDPDGQDRFRKYIPAGRSFVNTIEDYPYPYVIGRLCWEFPCVMPSDWEANNLHQAFNPVTVRDLKAALDATVLKRGVFTLCFHPHGWIRNDQVVDLIDHAVATHGRKVKFLTFLEAQERLDRNLLGGQPLRSPAGGDNGVRLIDLNNDGYADVVIGNANVRQTRLWSPQSHAWTTASFPAALVEPADAGGTRDAGARFGIVRADGHASCVVRSDTQTGAWHFDGSAWIEDNALLNGLDMDGDPIFTSRQGVDRGVRMRDVDNDGRCEVLVGNERRQAAFAWSSDAKAWKRLPFSLPPGAAFVDAGGADRGLRFIDMDEDGYDDAIFSNEKSFGLFLFESPEKGWSRQVLAGERGTAPAGDGVIPMIVRAGTNNGAWFHSRHLWVQNEDTDALSGVVDRRSFNALLAKVEPTPRTPSASLRAIRPRPGFTVQLVAAEPLTMDPVAFAWGPDGKFWVVEMADYPGGIDGHGKPGGRVRFLEDTDGDGVFDRSTVFLDGLSYPNGVAPWRKGVLVSSAPELLYAEDSDGDGRADVRTPLFTGFREGNPQHRFNGLVWGLDNWLYCANGDSGGKIKSSRTGAEILINGRDFRIRPDDGLIQVQTGQTQFGRSRDDWGDWFGCNNINPMYHFVLDDHYLRRNSHIVYPEPRVNVSVTPGAAPVFPVSRTLPRFNDPGGANAFTSACSVIVYRDDLFGPAFEGNSFVSEPVHNLVHREVMSAQGVTFTSRRAPDEASSEFLASSDNWFRPTTIKTGPDGALWVADMYRAVIEHPEWIPKETQERLDLRAGHDKGRIYRIFPVGARPRPIPRLDRLDTPGLVAALDSPSGWQRDMAQQMLIWKNDPAAVEPLVRLAADGPRPLARLHALCALDGLGALTPAAVLRALEDPHPGVRRHAVRLSESLLAAAPEIGDALAKRIDDADPRVRLQLAYSLGQWGDARAGRALGRLLARDAEDRYIVAAALSSLNRHVDAAIPEVFTAAGNAPPPAAVVESLITLAAVRGGEGSLAPVINLMAPPAGAAPAAWQISALAGFLDALDRRKTPLAALQAGDSEPLRAAIGRLPPLFAAARARAADEQAAPQERLAAVRVLGRGPSGRDEDLQALAALLTPRSPDELQAAVVTALGRLGDAHVPVLLLKGWPEHAPTLRSAILDALLSREEWLKEVLDAIESRRLAPGDLGAARRQRLIDHASPQVRERAAALLAGSIDPNRQKVIDAYGTVAQLTGNPANGAAIFQKTCSVCHRLAGVGQAVGPDLAGVPDKSTPSLLIAILDPNRAVEARYVNYVAVTTDALTLTGILAGETSTAVTLVGADGRQQNILRKDLQSLTATGKSLMPEGLETEIPPQGMADLIAMLGSAGPPPKRFPGNNPDLALIARDGSLELTATRCEIYGKTLVFEDKYKNLGFWSSPDDQAAWSLEVRKAGEYDVWFDWSCDDGSAGNTFLLTAGAARLSGKVTGTGNWDTYRQAKMGTIRLDAGRQRLILMPAGAVKGALIDLRSVRLLPRSP